MTASGKKGYETDLTLRTEPEESLESLFASAREKIAKGFADSLPAVMNGYINLATNEEIDPDTRRKASDRILDTFLPNTAGKIQQGHGTTIQILNAMPIPEVRMDDGKAAPLVTIGETRYALPPPTKRTISPVTDKRRSDYLGPQVTPTSSSPAPAEKITVLPEKP